MTCEPECLGVVTGLQRRPQLIEKHFPLTANFYDGVYYPGERSRGDNLVQIPRRRTADIRLRDYDTTIGGGWNRSCTDTRRGALATVPHRNATRRLFFEAHRAHPRGTNCGAKPITTGLFGGTRSAQPGRHLVQLRLRRLDRLAGLVLLGGKWSTGFSVMVRLRQVPPRPRAMTS